MGDFARLDLLAWRELWCHLPRTCKGAMYIALGKDFMRNRENGPTCILSNARRHIDGALTHMYNSRYRIVFVAQQTLAMLDLQFAVFYWACGPQRITFYDTVYVRQRNGTEMIINIANYCAHKQLGGSVLKMNELVACEKWWFRMPENIGKITKTALDTFADPGHMAFVSDESVIPDLVVFR